MAAMSLDLPPGFRFRPTELEIINYYLRLKITGNDEEAIGFIREVNFLKWEPWELPGLSGIATKDHEWFYFSQPDKKGKQFNRTTNSGFWKVTGNDKEIFSGGRSIGKKKILVFHQGSAVNGKKTDWVMHEHRTTLEELDGTKPGQKPYVFCRLFYKPKQNSGKAPESPALDVRPEDRHPTTNESRHSENSDGMACDTIATRLAKSTSESTDKGTKGRKRKYPTKAGPSKSKRRVDLQPETPLTSLSDAAAVSFPNTAKSSPEEAESDPRQASALGEEGDNQVTGYHTITSNECLHPENSDGMAHDTIATGTAKLASESPDKGSKGRKRYYSSKAGPAKSKRSAASASPATGEFLHSDTIPSVECSNSNSSAENQVAEMKQLIADEVDLQPESNLWTPLTSLSDTAAVLSPNTAKSSPEEAESGLAQASVSPASVQAEDYPTIDGTTSDTRAPVECGDNNFNAYSAENQVTDTEFDQQLQEELKWLPFLLQNQIDWNVNSPNTAKSSPEEAEASASPASGEEAENHVTSYSSTEYLDESTSNTKAFTGGCDHINISCAPPELLVEDIDWNSLLLCPIDPQTQKEFDRFCMSSFVANEPNYLNDGVALQNGTIDSDAYSYDLWDPMPDYADESLPNDPSSQKTTIPFDPRPCFMESVKDDGSHSAPSANKLNATV